MKHSVQDTALLGKLPLQDVGNLVPDGLDPEQYSDGH